jgi:hypothetical protein
MATPSTRTSSSTESESELAVCSGCPEAVARRDELAGDVLARLGAGTHVAEL